MTTLTKLEKTVTDVKHYYGEVLQGTDDLKTSACCTADSFPRAYRGLLNQIHPEILDRFYGCGSPLPYVLDGLTVLDLGCGTGRDAYLLSALVGEKGRVLGVDMTEAQLEVAKRHIHHQKDAFGYSESNVAFFHGQIEDLAASGIEDNSVDLVVSNCVINLSADKERVFSEIFRVLKPGGELYFSDIFADRRIPDHLAADPILLGECLGGAMYSQDFRRMLARLDCWDYRIVSSTPIEIHNPEVDQKIGMVKFYSQTVRAFKLPMEDRCENYGHVAWYLGTIPQCPHAFKLDDHHEFKTGLPVPVCGNTAAMLADSRYGKHFRVVGDRNTHFGIFDCEPTTSGDEQQTPGACC